MVLPLIIAGVGAAASLFGGVQGQQEGRKQAKNAKANAAARAAETKRITERQVVLEERNIKGTLASQEIGFLAGGVTLAGSPLLLMEETRRFGAENIEEIKKAGEAGSAAQIAEGNATAKSAKASGRQALIGGITGAAGSVSGFMK